MPDNTFVPINSNIIPAIPLRATPLSARRSLLPIPIPTFYDVATNPSTMASPAFSVDPMEDLIDEELRDIEHAIGTSDAVTWAEGVFARARGVKSQGQFATKLRSDAYPLQSSNTPDKSRRIPLRDIQNSPRKN